MVNEGFRFFGPLIRSEFNVGSLLRVGVLAEKKVVRMKGLTEICKESPQFGQRLGIRLSKQGGAQQENAEHMTDSTTEPEIRAVLNSNVL